MSGWNMPPGVSPGDIPGNGPDDLPDELEGEQRCKFCGAEGLEWIDTGMRFRLVDESGKFHECRRRVASAEDFDE